MTEKHKLVQDEVQRFDDIAGVSDKKATSIDEIDSLPWNRYGGYKVRQYIKRFFSYKPRPSKELNLEDVVANLLEPFTGSEIPNETLEKCQELLRQQRTIEDTRARRRLERWATKLIGIYLVIVFILVVANGFIHLLIKESSNEFITEKVMIVLLTTTTINIIGLGIIVLKGHFPQRNKDKKSNKDSKTN